MEKSNQQNVRVNGSQNEINVKELIPYIVSDWRGVTARLRTRTIRLGEQYNENNDYAQTARSLGNPIIKAEKWAEEYDLIKQKKSKLPYSQRRVVQEVVGRARARFMYHDVEKQQRRPGRPRKEGNRP